MNDAPLEYYVGKFQNLNTMRLAGHNKPHKVCMLLAVMDLIGSGVITENKIEFTDQLRQSFSKHFERLRAGDDQDSPENPFFYLTSEGFWFLQARPGYEQVKLDRYSKSKVAYAYLDSDLFSYMKSPIVSPDLRYALTQNLTNLPELYLRWAKAWGLTEQTAHQYLQLIQHSLSAMAQQAGLASRSLTELGSWHHYHKMVTPLRELKEFKVADYQHSQFLSRALDSYSDFLAELAQVDMTQDIDDILHRPGLIQTEKLALIKARMGQGVFRQQVLSRWNGCAVTGYQTPAVLVASHIKPWRHANDVERLDPNNGLMLVPNLDKAFDKGFISFDEQGAILISSKLERPEVLGISPTLRLQQSLTAQQDYLAHHRSLFFSNSE
ncbi:HNH endonuclease [Rheinheimera sp.]|uniref:HNH endonuclease n=1 Tax=Rheinheimera sp. TaxID=1869214 RepID=UPI00307CEB88